MLYVMMNETTTGKGQVSPVDAPDFDPQSGSTLVVEQGTSGRQVKGGVPHTRNSHAGVPESLTWLVTTARMKTKP